jgi:ABC-type transporter Mla MlaB component
MINCKTSSFRAITLNDQTIAFQIKGKFGKDVNRELREEIMTALKGFQQNVIIDLTRVDNIDTSAAALLVECIRLVRPRIHHSRCLA